MHIPFYQKYFLLKISLVLLALLVELPLVGQSKTQWLKYADLSFSEKDFYGASLYYGKALEWDTTNVDIVAKFSKSLRLYNNYRQAEKYYTYLYELDQGESYPEALFWLGMMQKSNGRYKQAKNSFQAFLDIYNHSDAFSYKKALQEVESCNYAINAITDSADVIVKNIGQEVNSVNADFAAVYRGDSELLFASMRSENEIYLKDKKAEAERVYLYKALQKDGEWVLEEKVDSVINKPGYHVANASFGTDTRYLYFSVCDSVSRCNIYYSKNTPAGWLEPKPVNINLAGYTTTQPAIAKVAGKEVLLFASDRPGGKGKFDIWFAVQEGIGKFSDPVNLGPPVNTIDDEVTPWFDSDSSILYFSSGWHYGFGGFDIFKSKGNLRSQSSPENLSYPINSSANDFYFSLNHSKDKGTLSSNRLGVISEKAETCCNDIWSIAFPTPSKIEEPKEPIEDTQQAESVVAELKKVDSLLPLSLFFHNDEPGPKSTDTITSKTYKECYLSYINQKDQYYKSFLDGSEDDELKDKEHQLSVFFEEKVDDGYKNLDQFLEKLLKILEAGKKATITVQGRASPLANSDYNANLSKRRVSSFVNYVKSYQNEAFVPFMKDTDTHTRGLIIRELPIGESEADSFVNDDYYNPRLSVYSPAASAERRIDIVSLTLEEE